MMEETVASTSFRTLPVLFAVFFSSPRFRYHYHYFYHYLFTFGPYKAFIAKTPWNVKN